MIILTLCLLIGFQILGMDEPHKTKTNLNLAKSASSKKVLYKFSNEPIDVVIPCHSKDAQNLELVIKGVRDNVKNCNRVIIVSGKKLTDRAEWFDEKLFPFTKQTIAAQIAHHDPKQTDYLLTKPKGRIGWVYQQLLKLYALRIIPKISSNALIVDADTVFCKPVSFQDESDAPLFNPGTYHHEPYFVHAAKLIPGFKKVFPKYSGISHHMLFQRSILEDLFGVIRAAHKKDPWKAICSFIDPDENSGVSEYELYFNFTFSRSRQGKIRHLKRYDSGDPNDVEKLSEFVAQGYDYISCHNWQYDS